MLKKCLLFTLFLLTACAAENDVGYRYCPNVSIVPEYSRATEFFGNGAHFKAEIAGYEGYCRYNQKNNQTYASITPIFEITRLSDTGGKSVEIAYYADTSDNDDKLMGRQHHSFRTTVDKKGEKVLVNGKEMMVLIPNDQPGYRINLGIDLTKKQYMYNRKQGLQY